MSKSEMALAEEKVFYVDRAKQGRAACKACKEKCLVSELRIAKLTSSPVGKCKNWYHVDCLFKAFIKQRPTTIRITSSDDIDGWNFLNNEDQINLRSKISEAELAISKKVSRKSTTLLATQKIVLERNFNTKKEETLSLNENTKARYFKEFTSLVKDFVGLKRDKANDDNSTITNIVKKYFINRDCNKFEGDLLLWLQLLFPEIETRTHNLQREQLVKLFSKLFNIQQDLINTRLQETTDDVAQVIQYYFKNNKKFEPAKKNLLLIQEVDDFLSKLWTLSKPDEQLMHFRSFICKCTSNNLKILIRIILQDLSLNVNLDQVLKALSHGFYTSYTTYKSLKIAFENSFNSNSSIMTLVQPLLSKSCPSVEIALKECFNGCYAEIKHYGERIQIHKDGSNFKFFSNTLKLVSSYQSSQIKHILIKAFPSAKNFIIDCTCVNNSPCKSTKKTTLMDKMCIYVFDCMYYNGISLTNKSMEFRKNILKENLKEISEQVTLLPFTIVKDKRELTSLIDKVLDMEREAIILKDVKSVYNAKTPSWFTIERHNLYSNPDMESLDLIMLGYFNCFKGSNVKASFFLMGCYDTNCYKYCTVVKVFACFSNKTCEKLRQELKMVEINRDPSKVPDWLICKKTMIPDFVAKIPTNQPVWEIRGTGFLTDYDTHTANGFTIKHPHVVNTKTNKQAVDITLNYVKKVCNNKNSKQEISSYKNIEKPLKRKRKLCQDFLMDEPKLAKIEKELSKVTVSQTCLEEKVQIFEGIKLLIEDGGEVEFEDSLQDFLSCGGVILKPEHWLDATHVLHLEDSIVEQNIRSSKNAHHIIVEWIVDSVKSCALQDIRLYTVRWEPIQNISL